MRWERTVPDGMAWHNPVKRMRFRETQKWIQSPLARSVTLQEVPIAFYSVVRASKNASVHSSPNTLRTKWTALCVSFIFSIPHSLETAVSLRGIFDRIVSAAFGRHNSFHYFAQFDPWMINDLISQIFFTVRNKPRTNRLGKSNLIRNAEKPIRPECTQPRWTRAQL